MKNEFIQFIRDYKDHITIAGLIIMIILSTILLIVLMTDGYECLSNPITYYENFKNTSCYCMKKDLF